MAYGTLNSGHLYNYKILAIIKMLRRCWHQQISFRSWFEENLGPYIYRDELFFRHNVIIYIFIDNYVGGHILYPCYHVIYIYIFFNLWSIDQWKIFLMIKYFILIYFINAPEHFELIRHLIFLFSKWKLLMLIIQFYLTYFVILLTCSFLPQMHPCLGNHCSAFSNSRLVFHFL